MAIIIKNLNKEMTLFDGTPIQAFNSNTPLTFKKALVAVCELHQPSRSGQGEALQAFNIGLKIFKAQDSVELTEDELNDLRKFVNSSKIFLSGVIGQLIKYLDEARKSTS